MPFDAALFDLDGVLVDSRAAISGCLNHALDVCGLETVAPERLYPLIGPPLHDAFVELLAEQQADPGLAPDCVAAYRERYRAASITDTVVQPGIPDAIAELSGRLPLGVATSKPTPFAVPILETLELAAYFGPIVGPDLGARSEPKSETVGRALADLAVRGEIAIIGDRSHDVVAGRANGITTIGVTWGIGPERELRDAGAHHVVHTPAELVALLVG